MRENELFESHLQRTVPSFIPDDEDAPGRAGGRKKSVTIKKTQHLLLTTEQKYDIATQEMEEVRSRALARHVSTSPPAPTPHRVPRGWRVRHLAMEMRPQQ